MLRLFWTGKNIYPTGLKARVTEVAVSHTDMEYVNKPAVAIATLKNPVIFHGMGAPKTEVSLYIVLMLAIHDPELVVHILRKIILVIEKDEAMKKIPTAESSMEIKNIMQEHIVSVSKIS